MQVLAGLRYNDPAVFEILGGKQIMIESPIIDEIINEAVNEAVAKALQNGILHVLRRRFGDVPVDLENQLRSVQAQDQLTEFNAIAGSCSNLEEFRKALG
ncbi:MAG: hypothetical protein KY475_12960 [Planctomycetes bacterium]|nr:hypothetical protein [Planctomycetota bacterium]